MDPTVPAGAAILLDFIRETEVGRKDRASYDVIYANKQHKLAKPLTSMTLDEVQAEQRRWSKNHGSSAAGGYQFMRATLRGLISELGLRGSQVLDADLQDRLGYHLLKRRGYADFMAGRIDRAAFGKRLAMEWASFPVLAPTRGAHRSLKRGQSYYCGDALNKALVSPEKVEAVLDRVKPPQKPVSERKPPSRSDAPETPKRQHTPTHGGKTLVGAIVVALAAGAWAVWGRIADFFSFIIGG